MSKPLCKNCKHYAKHKDQDICIRKVLTHDLVFGHKTYPTCHTQRSHAFMPSVPDANCGEHGAHFEPVGTLIKIWRDLKL